ncbi:DUF3800 domain-containing protein [Enhygromyxa salina]|uniref:DUF3800 domain-containing protein n=1 Tax=Enhygromyxa salina TaxID=215803 RepID=A0A2S9YVC8_9BACT|nr:DUF3800 domain-containing protein [Enhygromyxa salina]PRQ09043.1 hypothetical protein ENSA7_10330 [Enhygromyxa salina]
MAAAYPFYMDDSGARHPDRQLSDGSRPDWFALGGILVRQQDEQLCRRMHSELCAKWGIGAPLHSEEIRNRKKNFRWLAPLETRNQFLAELQAMLLAMPVVGIACVIDRPGYHARYHGKYGSQKWSLCRSSFTIGVERASKFARSRGCKLNVYVERSDRKTDRQVKTYFEELKRAGHPFDHARASKYSPLNLTELGETLHDFKMKRKSSPMMQIADLYLYPICRGGYDASYYPFGQLRSASKLIDLHVDDVNTSGIKYYCFENVAKKE